MPVLINATVASNFASVGRLDLLHAIYGTVYMADAVYQELQAGAARGYTFLIGLEAYITPPQATTWLHLVSIEGLEEPILYQRAVARLDQGEAVSLAIAQRRGWRFLTDDQGARRYAKQTGVPIIGSVGILLQLIHLGLLEIDEANTLLAQMITRARYHAPITDLRTLL